MQTWVATGLTEAPLRVALEILGKADAIVEFALIAFAGATVPHLLICFQLACLLLTSSDSLLPQIIFAVGADTTAVARSAGLETDTVLLLAAARASAVDMLERDMGQLD